MNAGDFFYINAGGAFLNLDTPVVPPALFIALFTDSVNAVGVGTEVTAGDYARASLPAGSFTVIVNTYLLANDFDFSPAVAAWGTIQSLALVTVATGSLTNNVVAFGDLTETPPGVTIDADDTFRILSGINFTITFN